MGTNSNLKTYHSKQGLHESVKAGETLGGTLTVMDTSTYGQQIINTNRVSTATTVMELLQILLTKYGTLTLSQIHTVSHGQTLIMTATKI